ncbi:hypothetical protein ES703_53440 [subsurface metagenome]
MSNKYRKGATINSLTLLTLGIEAGEWIYYRRRPLHPGFILHMTFSTVLGGLRAGNFAVAEERQR